MNKTMAACIVTFLIAVFLWIAFPTLGGDFDAAMWTLIGAIGMSILSLVLLILSIIGMNRPESDAAPDPDRASRSAQRCKRFAAAQSIAIAVSVGLALLNHATDTGFMAGVLGDIILTIVLWVMVPVLAIVLTVWAVQAYRAKKTQST